MGLGQRRRADHPDELRLRVVTARAGENLAELSLRTANAWKLNETSVANQIRIDKRLSEGEPIKIAIREPYEPKGTGIEPETSRAVDRSAMEDERAER